MITKNKPQQKEDFSNPDEDVNENREELIAENALLMERYVLCTVTNSKNGIFNLIF